VSALTAHDKTFLLQLARSSIAGRLGFAPQAPAQDKVSPAVDQKRGCFVTLHKQGDLRGCIGTIEPQQSLKDGVAENAVNAAFRDPRFPPLTRDELESVDIEVSVLTVPERLDFKDAADLTARLRPNVDGVILSSGWNRATFLPQVWEQLPDERAFLSHLCRKAGLSGTCWQKGDIRIEVYQAEYFSE